MSPSEAPALGSAALSISTAVHNALKDSPFLEDDRYEIETLQGAVRIHGEVRSFYEKQMAQETILRIDGVDRVENLLRVSWS